MEVGLECPTSIEVGSCYSLAPYRVNRVPFFKRCLVCRSERGFGADVPPVQPCTQGAGTCC